MCRAAGYRYSIDIIDTGGYICSPECRAGSWRAGAGGGWRGACCSWPGWCRPWPAAGAPSCPGTARTRRGPAPAVTWGRYTASVQTLLHQLTWGGLHTMTGPGPRAPRPRLAASLTSASSCGWVEAEGGQAEVTSCATVRVTPRFLT